MYEKQLPILEIGAKHNIVTEGFSSLTYLTIFPFIFSIYSHINFFSFFQNRPITSRRGGPVDIPLKKIGERLGATDDQVLLAWAKAKGAVILT